MAKSGQNLTKNTNESLPLNKQGSAGALEKTRKSKQQVKLEV